MDGNTSAHSNAISSFPKAARIEVPTEVARDLLSAAEELPQYQNKEFYSAAVQEHVLNHVRSECAEGFDWLIDQIKRRLSLRPYWALIGGLQLDEGNRLFVAINRAFGELVARPYEAPRAQLVHYIQPETDIPSSRGGRESERLHTDAADWETPVEFISMVCVRPDPNDGGRSRILDVDSIRDDVKRHLGADTLSLLEKYPVPWRLADYRGGGVSWRPVLTSNTVCWRRYTIDLALGPSGGKLPEEMSEALDAFEQVISSSSATVEFLMGEGELLFSDNTRTVHSRTEITEHGSNRLMIRSWIRGF
jgi:hypothetical protein